MSYIFGKAPIEKVLEISERLYNQRKTNTNKCYHGTRKSNTQFIDSQCTFKPNTNKKTFVKYPNPPHMRKQEDVLLEEKVNNNTWISNHSKERNRQNTLSKPKTIKRLDGIYRWEQNRKLKLLNTFMSREASLSIQKANPEKIKRAPSKQQVRQFLNKSVDYENGVSQYLARQRTARLRKQQKQYLLKHPNSHLWNYTPSVISKIDADLTHYMQLGEQRFSKNHRISTSYI